MTIAEIIEMEKTLLIERHNAELQAIRDESEVGSVGNSNWVSERLDMTFKLIKERILYPFRNELEGDIVFYSDKNGVEWRFNKSRFNAWINENFKDIDWSGSKCQKNKR